MRLNVMPLEIGFRFVHHEPFRDAINQDHHAGICKTGSVHAVFFVQVHPDKLINVLSLWYKIQAF
jgi:hypothetical protein